MYGCALDEKHQATTSVGTSVDTHKTPTMSDYASLTVAQLKEQLKAKGLALDGKKADLVQRLEELDFNAPEPAKTEESAPAPQAEEPKQETTETTQPTTSENGDQLQPLEESKKPKELTPEERKQLAVDLLTKKIQRAEKFGDEQLAEAARKDLSRVEKFGVDPGTALAKEIGLVDKQVNLGLGHFKKHRGFKNKNKGKKNRNKGKVGK